MSNVIPFTRKNLRIDNDMSVVTPLASSAPQLTTDRRLYRHPFESAVVLDLEPGMSSFELYLFKTNRMLRTKGRIRPPPRRCNAEALAAYANATGIQVEPAILKRGPFIAAIDGVTNDGKRVVEISFDTISADRTLDPLENFEEQALPEHVVVRLHHLMIVADAQFADLWTYDSRYGHGRTVSVRRDSGVLAQIFAAWDVFEECVGRNLPLLWSAKL